MINNDKELKIRLEILEQLVRDLQAQIDALKGVV